MAGPSKRPLLLQGVSVPLKKRAPSCPAAPHFIFPDFASWTLFSRLLRSVWCLWTVADVVYVYEVFVCKSWFFRSTAMRVSASAESLQNNTAPLKTCHNGFKFPERQPVSCVSQTRVWQNVNQPAASGHMGSIWKVGNHPITAVAVGGKFQNAMLWPPGSASYRVLQLHHRRGDVRWGPLPQWHKWS